MLKLYNPYVLILSYLENPAIKFFIIPEEHCDIIYFLMQAYSKTTTTATNKKERKTKRKEIVHSAHILFILWVFLL